MYQSQFSDFAEVLACQWVQLLDPLESLLLTTELAEREGVSARTNTAEWRVNTTRFWAAPAWSTRPNKSLCCGVWRPWSKKRSHSRCSRLAARPFMWRLPMIALSVSRHARSSAVRIVAEGVYLAVDKKKWLTDERFLETFSIVSAIPGPSSTQVAFFIALASAL